jgi:transposase
MKALKNKHLKKTFMWYKVQELFSKGLNKTQISFEVGIHRKTVRKYLNMSEEEFYKWIEQPKNQPRKLNDYYEYVQKLLEAQPYLSAAQVEDRLKENFKELPMVHSKTVYNFVQSVRRTNGIKKQNNKQPRQYQKLPETEYGHQAQVDFGQYTMQKKTGGWIKVFFFIMILSRSRQKFIYFQTNPFTTSTTIEAHNKAFEFFKGQTRVIIYDQDRVLIIDENLGDILLTQEFHTYCSQMNFKPVFCRKSDPESKGKVENVVKYVKNNFLRGRTYQNTTILNQSALEWLSRTANGKIHAGIKKIPMEEWVIEQSYLIPLKTRPKIETENFSEYKVRKDNTINYKSNFYTLPLGTYQGPDTWVLLKAFSDEIQLFTLDKSLLAAHPICYERGMLIRNTSHLRESSKSIMELKHEVLLMMPDQELGQLYIDRISSEKPRYLRDNLLVMKKKIPGIEKDFLKEATHFCLENNLWNGASFIEVAEHYQKEAQQEHNSKAVLPDISIKKVIDNLEYTPKVSNLSTYETLL